MPSNAEQRTGEVLVNAGAEPYGVVGARHRSVPRLQAGSPSHLVISSSPQQRRAQSARATVDPMDATGTAVVTGASRGIGRAVAIELARRGFDVVATMRTPSDGAGIPAEIRVAALDVTRPETIELPNGLRVLVNNAGVERDYLPVEHASLEMWREIFETNLFGLVEVTKRAIPIMRAAGGGVVCNVTSSSVLAPMPFYAAYRASKAAVGALGESLRTELAPFGIRVIEVMPGATATDMYAASERTPEAAQYEPYRSMGERIGELRRPGAYAVTPAEDVAVAIAEAILDDDGPLRYGCDPMSVGLLDGWRRSDDEVFRAGMAKAFEG
jgi:NAD(P)-dependent dehydrogenase (short-subunit alcohol dehydrogenase family)